MKDPILGMNPLAALIVTLSFQNKVLLLMKLEGSHTWNEPFGCSHCDSEFQHQVLKLIKHEESHTSNEPFVWLLSL